MELTAGRIGRYREIVSDPTRRQLLVGAACAGAVGVGTWAVLSSGTSDAVVQSFGGVAVGDVVGDVTVIAIHAPHLGAVPFVLRTSDGVTFQVDVLARDPAGPNGVAQTQTLSVFVANRGDGATATDETQGLAAMAIAARLGDVARTPELLTLRERNERYPDGSFGVPLS